MTKTVLITGATAGFGAAAARRFAGAGWRTEVERLPDPSDRRGVLVRLTPEGKTAVDGAFGALLAAEAELVAALPADQQETLASLLRTLLAPFSPPEG